MAQSLDPTGHIVAMPKGQRTRRSVGMWTSAPNPAFERDAAKARRPSILR